MKHPFSNLLCLFLLFLSSSICASGEEDPYLIGRGMADVTGPVHGMQMWGFGRADQITEGLHIRQRSRAFVIAQADAPAKRLVFVSADLGSIEHHITLAVIDRLQDRYGGVYTIKNVILSATHTHAGPGGYWHSRLDNGFDGGFYPEYFEAIVSGITYSIVKAHEDLQAGNIYLAKSQVANAGANRSMAAYLENPQAERDQYAENTPTEMTLLKFVDHSGAIGALNWYALHPTAMNFYNRLISGDHKGYASWRMEQQRGNRYTEENGFVAAFAQADAGDVTPNTNLDNTGPGETDVETTKIMGERQLQAALAAYANASEPLLGGVQTRQIYVDLRDYPVADRFTKAGKQTTCPSAYGYSFAGGSTEDGGGHFLFREGMIEQSVVLDFLIRLLAGAPRWTEPVKSCQAPKPILFETGSGAPPLQSQIRSVTLALVGQLAILAVPAEVTTMAGRRLKAAVMDELGELATHIVIAGYTNGYAGYVTTPEEYRVQQYEGGHTLHGRWTLPAYQQIASGLARDLKTGRVSAAKTTYDDWRGKSFETSLPSDEGREIPTHQNYGDVYAKNSAQRTQYSRGETVKAEFWSSNPTAAYRTDLNYLRVEHNTAEGWATVATDGDWSTKVRWRTDKGGMVATASWHIPTDVDFGEYRLVHTGVDLKGNMFSGVSRGISIVQGEQD